jgi:long-subunit fatty acid transport protein
MENRSMGGLSVYSDSISINLTNPAAYSELKLVNYSVGINYSNINLKSENSNEKATTASINYLSVAVPTKHFVFGFGIIPKSSVGYLLESNDDSKTPNEINRYEGNGGVNTTFLTMGFKILKKIRFGISANYDFGSLEHSNSRFLDGLELYTRVQSNSSLSGLSFDYSVLFREEISKNLTIHATYGMKQSSKLSSNNSQILSTIPVTGGYGGDTENIDLTALNLDKTKILIPAQTTFGFGIGKDTKWFIGMDYSYGGAGGYENKLFNLENVEYKKASKFAIGGLFVPNYNSFTSYVSRIVYRAGIRIEKSGLHIQNQSINEYGINFGLGLPFQGFQNLNLGVEIGKRGTKKGGLIEENFVSFRLGISLNDRWFVKNKYN